MQKAEIRSVAIVGGGKMGRQIFSHLIKYPLNVHWINRSAADAEKQKLQKRFNRLLRNQIISRPEYDDKLSRVRIANSLPEGNHFDLVIETVTEDIHIKNQFFAELEKRILLHTVVVSNSSSILPEKFSLDAAMKNRFAGFHFFYPVQPEQAVEIIPTTTLSQADTKRLLDFASAIQLKPLLQNEKTAFAANRFFLEIQSSLFNYCAEQKIEPALLDQIIQKHLFPTGIFLAMDHIGFNILYQAILNYWPMMDAPERLTPMLGFIRQKMSEGHFGYQTGQGFLRYPLHEHVVNDPQLKEAILKEVNTIFRRFAASYTEKGLITEKELQWVIEAFTMSDYTPFS